MTNAEAKTALARRTPVIYRGIEYLRVKQIIYWIDDTSGEFRISLTLVDKNNNSTMQARVEDVQLYDYKDKIPTILS